ncbi:hypothetical protein ACFYPC_29345 [Streptomyces sp. NPDC005808]|uniref:hypothetical protein n=1 Tax=Streptomyces sp. NPDC005808 TaxID=3364734 RepID=UPI0036C6792C
MIIDDNVAVRQSQTWWSNGESAATVASGYAQMDNGQVSDDNRYLYSGTGGVGKTKSCTSTEHPEQDLYSVIQVFAADRDNSHAMKKLITAYTEALEESSACA